MGKIIISENVSIDGVVQDPTGGEGFRHGGWTNRSMGADRDEWAKVLQAEALSADALLLGRRSDEWFATRWRSRDGAWADRLNTMPKYVVSRTLDHPAWTNSTVLRGDVAAEVAALKRELDGDIVVYGSIALAHALLERDLADELRLIVFPVILGSGTKIFAETGGQAPMRLMSARTIGDGLVHLTYARARAGHDG